MSRSSEWESQVPDALIHMMPSILMDVFPPAACVSAGLRPIEAENARNASRSGVGVIWADLTPSADRRGLTSARRTRPPLARSGRDEAHAWCAAREHPQPSGP